MLYFTLGSVTGKANTDLTGSDEGGSLFTCVRECVCVCKCVSENLSWLRGCLMYDKYTWCHIDAPTQGCITRLRTLDLLCLQYNKDVNELELKEANGIFVCLQ